MTAENLKWWQKTIVYQIYPKSFQDTTGSGTGDLNGVTQHLDYLKNLGVGAIWLTPVYPSPQVDNGYDISNYTEIDSAYGTMKDFENLIAEADKRGIKIVMDLVFNHSSDKHEWFLESKKNRTNEKADWYIWRDAKPDGTPPTNWRGIFGGSAWTWNEQRQQYYLHSFAKEQPDLNWENPAVRQALFDAANFWLKKGVGGFRIDAIVYIKKPAEFKDGTPDSDGLASVHDVYANTAGILDFLHEFKAKVFDGHDIFTVGEANSVKPEELKFWVGNDGVFDMLFEFSHVNIMFPDGEAWHKPQIWKLTDLKKVITESQKATAQNGWYPIYFENHDKPRSVNHFFPQGTDTVKAAKVLAAILLTMRGTPFIFEGEELGFTNVAWDSIESYNDIGSHGQFQLMLQEGLTVSKALKFVHRFSRDNARTPMQWSDKKNAGFSTGTPWLPVNENYKTVNAEIEEKNSDSVLNWYRKLVQLRAGHAELIGGDYKLLLPDNEEIFAFSRSLNGNTLITAVNFSNEKVALPPDFIDKKILLDSESGADKNILKPFEARILQG
ncbi:MAG: alpha-glucosidase [Selenomonadaceae bacterium]|nr:alpha-glucosidase [Selenomonadaceae bacterium]